MLKSKFQKFGSLLLGLLFSSVGFAGTNKSRDLNEKLHGLLGQSFSKRDATDISSEKTTDCMR